MRACDGVRRQQVLYEENYSIVSSSQFIEQIIPTEKKKRVEHFAVVALFCDLIEVPTRPAQQQQEDEEHSFG